MAKDVGAAPGYKNACVLLSSNFRYFGALREALPRDLKSFADSIGRGHRVKHAAAVREALLNLIASLWKQHALKKLVGQRQRKPDVSVSCNCGEGSAECSKLK
jgi:hypothetical protein